MKILIVEDSEDLQEALREGLHRSAVDVASDGTVGLSYARNGHYEVIVLDLMLPGIEGLQLLREYRAHGGTAKVLILSARDQVNVRVQALESGADDYLVKPFAFAELLSRTRALVRRRHDLSVPIITIGDLVVDTARRRVTTGPQVVPLTRAEYSVLECLALRRGRVISKEQIVAWIQNADSVVDSKIAEVWVSTLRKKLREAGAVKTIETRRGFGYILE